MPKRMFKKNPQGLKRAKELSRPEGATQALTLTAEKPNQIEWLELLPQGIAISSELSRPALLLKTKDEKETLPVWLSPLDAGVALAELSQGIGVSPHSVTKKLMKELGLRVVECRINELVGHHQYAELIFQGHPTIKTLRVRADEAMSFTLQGGARFLSTRGFMAQCRDIQSGIDDFESGLKSGELKGFQVRPEMSSKKFPYMM